MIKVNPKSIADLVALKEAGVPVTLTSHPGNASLYKLVLWHCGIPEHLWDITCCKSDANNWPMHRLINGKPELLITQDLYERILRETTRENRFVTAYQHATCGTRLGRIHVKAKQECFPGVISSCSRILLSEEKRVGEMFEYLAETKKAEVFSRFITPDGNLRPINQSCIHTRDLASSFIRVLKELTHLLFSDEPTETTGGACYDGVITTLSVMLVQYWQTGRIDRYDISGPDMIHYSTQVEYQRKMSEMLQHLRKWDRQLIPGNMIIQMFPGTVARVGYVENHESEKVMKRKTNALKRFNALDKAKKKELWEVSANDESIWPIQINPKTDCYFSQYDLALCGGKLVVDDYWKSLSFESMRDNLLQANALLRVR